MKSIALVRGQSKFNRQAVPATPEVRALAIGSELRDTLGIPLYPFFDYTGQLTC